MDEIMINQEYHATLYKVFDQKLRRNFMNVLETTNRFAVVCNNYWGITWENWRHGQKAEYLYFQNPICSNQKQKIEMQCFWQRIWLPLAKLTLPKQQIQVASKESCAKCQSEGEMLIKFNFAIGIPKFNCEIKSSFLPAVVNLKKLRFASLDACESFILIKIIKYIEISSKTFRLRCF